jgi:hypothetical protein
MFGSSPSKPAPIRGAWCALRKAVLRTAQAFTRRLQARHIGLMAVL